MQPNPAQDMGRNREQDAAMVKRAGGKIVMGRQEKIEELVSSLESLKGAETVSIDHPSIRDAAGILELKICDPYPPQWPFYHVILPHGGVCRFSIELLLDKLREALK